MASQKEKEEGKMSRWHRNIPSNPHPATTWPSSVRDTAGFASKENHPNKQLEILESVKKRPQSKQGRRKSKSKSKIQSSLDFKDTSMLLPQSILL